jgi:hypothetical protein
MDAIEQAAARQHLAACPECAALAQSERRVDEAIASAMRDVPVPADLQQKVLKRLSSQRARFPWKRATVSAIAAMVLIGVSVSWYLRPKSVVSINDVAYVVHLDTWDKDKIESYFQTQNLTVRVPDKFNYRYLHHLDVVEFKGQRVAKLTLARLDGDPVVATILILPSKHFRIDASLQDSTVMEIRHARHNVDGVDAEFTFLIFYNGRLERFEDPLRG